MKLMKHYNNKLDKNKISIIVKDLGQMILNMHNKYSEIKIPNYSQISSLIIMINKEI